MNKRHIFIIFALAVVTAIRANGQSLSGIPAAFVDIGYGARPVALGSAFVVLADDANSVLWNPAGLTKLSAKEITFTYAKQLGLISYNFISFAGNFQGLHGYGGALIFSGDDQLRETTLYLSYSCALGEYFPALFKGLRIGVNVKLRKATFGNNLINAADYPLFTEEEIQEAKGKQVKGDAFGYGFDVGVLFAVNERISTGLVWRDPYAPVRWNSSVSGKYDQSVPGDLIFGLAFKTTPKHVILLDYRKSLNDDTRDRVYLGSERTLFDLFSIRAGFNQNLSAQIDRRYAVGMGLYRNFRSHLRISLDFTYQFHDLGNTPRIATSIRF